MRSLAAGSGLWQATQEGEEELLALVAPKKKGLRNKGLDSKDLSASSGCPRHPFGTILHWG